MPPLLAARARPRSVPRRRTPQSQPPDAFSTRGKPAGRVPNPVHTLRKTAGRVPRASRRLRGLSGPPSNQRSTLIARGPEGAVRPSGMVLRK